jgi:hypothetical protein
MNRDRLGERGAALVYVLFVLFITVTAGSLIALSLAIDARTRKEDARRIRLTALLDSAVVEAIAALDADPDAVGFARHPFGDGTIESSITDLPAGRRQLEARATYGGAERRVVAEVDWGPYGARVVAWRPVGLAAPVSP